MKIKVLSVTEVNRYIKKYISGNPILSHIEIEGELSNYKRHSSGHLYFTLKDENSKIACVMFKSSADQVDIDLKDGKLLVAAGQISVYERDGKYQLYVSTLKEAGVGDLHVKFEAMKEKLKSEGLFDEVLKKPLPSFPSKIAAVTSPTGAAIRDILTVLKRRNPLVDVVVYPVRVQGERSKDELVTAIDSIAARTDIDVVIVGRGGGSIEELWSFNEECVARAISRCPIPVISGVGHETDFTITDFVADVRAATPSAAAEISVPNLEQYVRELDFMIENVEMNVLTAINNYQQQLKLYHPKQLLLNFENKLMEYQQQLDHMADKLNHGIDKYFAFQTNTLEKLLLTLEMHSPIHTLNRGYALLENASSKVITSVNDVSDGEQLTVKLSDGIINTRVEEVIRDGGVRSGSKNI